MRRRPSDEFHHGGSFNLADKIRNPKVNSDYDFLFQFACLEEDKRSCVSVHIDQ